jgi:hypothetical protein
VPAAQGTIVLGGGVAQPRRHFAEIVCQPVE